VTRPETHPQPKRPRAATGVGTLAVLCLLLGGGGAGAAEGEDWRRFEFEQGNFSVELPTVPVQGTKEKWFPISSFVSHVYRSWAGKDAFGINHTDLPRIALAFASKKKIFNSTRDGFLEDSNATEVSYRETEMDGRSARELVYDIPAQQDMPALRGKATMFLEGKRLYVFWAEVTRTRTQQDLNRFFDSIRVWNRD